VPVAPPSGGTTALPRNDIRQYDQLVDHWWQPDGDFAALHWLADARASAVPQPAPGDLAVDLGCGGGLSTRAVRGYRHVGIDLSTSALAVAARHGVTAVRGDVAQLPVADACAAVVIAGEIFEHVSRVEPVVDEIARVLRPGGVAVFDTINDTWQARLGLVTIAERLPGGPPPGIHDPDLFVAPERLTAAFARHGMETEMWGLRPSVSGYARFLLRRRCSVRMVRTPSLALVYQGTAQKPRR
jgi:2-polyprenyl-6-hydroxyphenyl methylase/3-demethylubiquinone-9 3-methyltransferase